MVLLLFLLGNIYGGSASDNCISYNNLSRNGYGGVYICRIDSIGKYSGWYFPVTYTELSLKNEPIYSKGTTNYGEVTSTNVKAYPTNSRHTDGYWYEMTKAK